LVSPERLAVRPGCKVGTCIGASRVGGCIAPWAAALAGGAAEAAALCLGPGVLVGTFAGDESGLRSVSRFSSSLAFPFSGGVIFDGEGRGEEIKVCVD
jgi:hypothetical protein